MTLVGRQRGSCPLHASLHWCTGGHGHAIGVDMLIREAIWILHPTQELADTLSVTDRAVFVAHEEGAEISNFVMKLCNLCVEVVILRRVHLNLGLEVSQPLFLSLSAFESGNTMDR